MREPSHQTVQGMLPFSLLDVDSRSVPWPVLAIRDYLAKCFATSIVFEMISPHTTVPLLEMEASATLCGIRWVGIGSIVRRWHQMLLNVQWQKLRRFA